MADIKIIIIEIKVYLLSPLYILTKQHIKIYIQLTKIFIFVSFICAIISRFNIIKNCATYKDKFI